MFLPIYCMATTVVRWTRTPVHTHTQRTILPIVIRRIKPETHTSFQGSCEILFIYIQYRGKKHFFCIMCRVLKGGVENKCTQRSRKYTLRQKLYLQELISERMLLFSGVKLDSSFSPSLPF